MGAYMPMATTDRHNEIITALIIKLGSLIEKKEVSVWREECLLVHYGKRTLPESVSLVDIDKLKDVESFIESMGELYCVQPDLMLFKQNGFIKNKKRTRTAGFPDLVVEIWSESNDENEQAFKKLLYSTSPKTEHWHIAQDSNDVVCFLGENVLPKQSLTDILRTQNGIELDLRYMAINEGLG